VGFSNEDNCCQSQGIGKLIKEKFLKDIFIEKSIKEKLLKGIFRVD